MQIFSAKQRVPGAFWFDVATVEAVVVGWPCREEMEERISVEFFLGVFLDTAGSAGNMEEDVLICGDSGRKLWR